MGPLLKCTLDDIVLIKFHALCWKVALFSMVLCLLVVLPLNYTAECDPAVIGSVECDELLNMTDFEQTTLAHVPSLKGTAEDISDRDSLIVDVNARLFGIVLVAWLIYGFTCGKFQLYHQRRHEKLMQLCTYKTRKENELNSSFLHLITHSMTIQSFYGENGSTIWHYGGYSTWNMTIGKNDEENWTTF